MSEQLRGRWAGQRIPFGEGKLSPGHPARAFAEKAKRDAVRCLRDRHQTSGSSEVWHMPRCAMSFPCPENCLTKRSSSGRTHREHRRSFRSKGCQTEDGSGVGCLGNIGKLNMMLRRKNARCLRNSCFIPSHATESRARYRMTSRNSPLTLRSTVLF